MSSTIKKNFIYNLLLTISGYLFTFLTFPYVSRVLGVDNIGTFNFVDSIINYFILFSMLGVSTVGIREIAKNKNNKEELENTFRDIFLLNFIFTIIALIILVALIIFIPKFQNLSTLFYIGIIKLLFNFCLIEWFFTGIENFKFITIRSTIIKLVYVILVFIFVKEKVDLKLYYFLTCLIICINAVFNWYYLLKFIKFQIIGFNYKKYIRSVSIFGIYIILTSFYTTFNIVYLGFSTTEEEVGYYSTVTKLFAVLLSVYTAFTGVMMPRMTSLINDKKYNEFRENIAKSFNLLMLFSFPIIVFSIVFTKQIILFLFGEQYLGAVLPMQIVMPLLLVIGIEQILVIQVLMPLKKDNVIMWNSLIGAVFGVFLNVIFVYYFQSIGSALVWLFCEILILVLSLAHAKKYIEFQFPYIDLLRQFIYTIPIVLIIYFFSINIELSNLLVLIVGGLIVFIYYLCLDIIILKNSLLISILNDLKYKIFK